MKNKLTNTIKKAIKEILYLIHDLCYLLFVLKDQLAYQHFHNDIKREKSGKILYILGNGPSLNNVKSHITNRNDIELCCVNFSLITDIYYDLKPEMHVLTDGAFFNPDFPRVNEVYEALQKKITWNLKLFIPYRAYKQISEIVKVNPRISIVRYSTTHDLFKCSYLTSLKYFLYKSNFIMPIAQNVTIAAIFCAINMGYKRVELYGVEHSWLKETIVGKDNRLYCIDSHYYDNNQTIVYKPADASHKYYESLLILAKTFYSHIQLQEYADYLGYTEIINRTEGSFIDAYKKEY